MSTPCSQVVSAVPAFTTLCGSKARVSQPG